MRTSFGTNIVEACRKRVFYTETAQTIYEGMPVCYEFDATTNVLGYDKGAGGVAGCQTSPNTTAEGNQNEGKYLRVEDPDADNIHAFAGVVAGTSEAGKLGGRWIDIFVANGAIVPVRTDQNCTVGRTILAVHSGDQHFAGPYEYEAWAVAVACETSDLSGGAGIVLAKLEPNMFIRQKGDALSLLIDDQDTGNDMCPNIIAITSGQATGSCIALDIGLTTVTTSNYAALYLSTTNTGVGTSGFKALYAKGNAYGTAITGAVNALHGQMDVEAGCGLSGIASGLFAKVHVKTGGGTLSGAIYAGQFALGLDSAVTGNVAQLHFELTTTIAKIPDYFFIADTAQAIGNLSTGFLTASHGIRVLIAGAAYRILLDKE
ncbi:hypothetical protein LCGC14_1939540 [marine sediment metagenome]|uniref:Uncharacterized protein n=1 Tax=marine sediment metagenome TaxID=412755 RepID=A0A0F9FKN6_9ZZZZ